MSEWINDGITPVPYMIRWGDMWVSSTQPLRRVHGTKKPDLYHADVYDGICALCKRRTEIYAVPWLAGNCALCLIEDLYPQGYFAYGVPFPVGNYPKFGK